MEIENLEEYINLKCLFLECNGLVKISGLEAQKEMRCLYMAKNLIRKIENLEHMEHLDTIDLSDNRITKIENLSKLNNLQRIILQNNKLTDLESIEHLVDCFSLSVVDLQKNQISDPDCLEKVFAQMPNLHVLYLQGNPVCKKIKNYRKQIIHQCTNLQYLDDRPVFPKDRLFVEAFMRGGAAEEKAERQKWTENEHKKMMENINAFSARRKVIEESKRVQELKKDAEEKGLPTENIDVEPDSVDWLYGPKNTREKENQNDDSDQELPFISSKTACEHDESIFSTATDKPQSQVPNLLLTDDSFTAKSDAVNSTKKVLITELDENSSLETVRLESVQAKLGPDYDDLPELEDIPAENESQPISPQDTSMPETTTTNDENTSSQKTLELAEFAGSTVDRKEAFINESDFISQLD